MTSCINKRHTKVIFFGALYDQGSKEKTVCPLAVNLTQVSFFVHHYPTKARGGTSCQYSERSTENNI